MRTRGHALSRRITHLLAWLALATQAALAIAQVAQPLQQPAFQQPAGPLLQPVTGVTNAIQHAVLRVLESGRSLEINGRWADALTQYEEALHQYPENSDLQARFDVARLHYSLDQRYDDRSFREAVRSLSAQQALDQYSDLLGKIENHYYTNPPWQQLTQRGANAMEIALANENFLRNHGVRIRGQQVEALRSEIAQLPSRYAIRSARDASAVAMQIARLARQRAGIGETATLLEFTSAAAGGLDHYSSFLTPDQLRDIYSQIEGNFVGLGVELKADRGALLIVHVIPRSPAEKAGIHDGDRITAVDGQATSSLSTDEAASLLTGAEGSLVRVAVETPGTSPRELTVRRESVDVPSLEDVKIIDATSGVAYIRIPAFQKTTPTDLENALWDLHKQGMRSLVIDLRGNPGGLLTASVEIADKFIAEGGIVSTRGRSEAENFSYRAHRPGTWRVPLVVLIDGDSASASEIFAGAIKDSGRGKIVGTRSYGKGSVQGIFPLGKYGAGARLTTAKFYSPLDHPISNVGITPDVDVRNPPATFNYVAGYRGVSNETNQPSPTQDEKARGLQIAIGLARELPVAQL
ncbi:MAG: S41 family peptidase [Pirellulales bacterium]|nr:S41 family peptidase [Pirellulales bacterium]